MKKNCPAKKVDELLPVLLVEGQQPDLIEAGQPVPVNDDVQHFQELQNPASLEICQWI